jgi:hypothetical protein
MRIALVIGIHPRPMSTQAKPEANAMRNPMASVGFPMIVSTRSRSGRSIVWNFHASGFTFDLQPRMISGKTESDHEHYPDEGGLDADHVQRSAGG